MTFSLTFNWFSCNKDLKSFLPCFPAFQMVNAGHFESTCFCRNSTLCFQIVSLQHKPISVTKCPMSVHTYPVEHTGLGCLYGLGKKGLDFKRSGVQLRLNSAGKKKSQIIVWFPKFRDSHFHKFFLWNYKRIKINTHNTGQQTIWFSKVLV